MEGESSADRRGGRYHVILCVVIGEMTLSTCLLCRLLTQDENQSLWRHLQSGVVSENGLIASKNAIDDAFHLARDEHHKNRTKVKVVELY